MFRGTLVHSVYHTRIRRSPAPSTRNTGSAPLPLILSSPQTAGCEALTTSFRPHSSDGLHVNGMQPGTAEITAVNLLDSVFSQLSHLQILKYVNVAALGLLSYDHLLTFDDEVNYIWRSRWNVSKVLFLINRYIPYWDCIQYLFTMVIGTETSLCKTSIQICAFAASYGIVISEVILMMRAWAVWGKDRWVTLILFMLFIAIVVAPAIIDRQYFNGFDAIPPVSSAIHGCLFNLPNRTIYVDFVLIIITEAIALALMVIKAFNAVDLSSNSALGIIYRDGILYFVAILLASIANLVAILVAPLEMVFFLVVMQRVLHSICCTRVLIHIRSAYAMNNIGSNGSYSGQRAYHVADMPMNFQVQFRRQELSQDLPLDELHSDGSVKRSVTSTTGEVVDFV